MSNRSLPRSMRVTSALAALIVGTCVGIAGLVVADLYLLLAAVVVVLACGYVTAILLTEELRDVRRRHAAERVDLARVERDRQIEHTAADVAHGQRMGDRLSTADGEIARLRRELVSTADYVDELEERLATARELNAMLTRRPEVVLEVAPDAITA